jgi:hypothetical protein
VGHLRKASSTLFLRAAGFLIVTLKTFKNFGGLNV